MNERIITEMEKVLEVNIVPQVSRLPISIETVAKNIEATFKETADALVATARKLESRAQELRAKADSLQSNAVLANDLRQWVQYEREAFEEVQSLALVHVGRVSG